MYKPISAERLLEMIEEMENDDYEEPGLLACGIFTEQYMKNALAHAKTDPSSDHPREEPGNGI